MKRYLIIAMAACTLAVPLRAQDKPAPPKVVSLSLAEKNEYDLNQQKIENLNLRIQLLNSQIAQQQQALADEGTRLRDRLYKAHNLDPAKWMLQPDGRFVELPEQEKAPVKVDKPPEPAKKK